MKQTLRALSKDNFIKRLWVLALSALFFFFYFVVGVFLNLDLYPVDQGVMSADELRLNTYLFKSAFCALHEAGGALLIFLGIFALGLAYTSFSYLSDRGKVDCYHSLPVTRGELYGVNIGISFVLLGVPYLVFGLISACIAGSKIGMGYAFSYTLMAWIANMGFFALMFMTAVAAMMLSGVGIAGVALSLVFFFIGPLAVTAVRSLAETYFVTFYYRDELFKPLLYIVSPALWGVEESYALPLGVRVVTAYILSALLGAAGLVIYRLRRSESSLRALGFARVKTPLKIAVSTVAALSFTSLIVQITGRDADLWAAFGLVSGVVISSLFLEVVYALDFRAALGGRLSALASLVLAGAVLIFFRFDLMGFDSFVPDEERVVGAGFYSYLLDGSYIDDESVELVEDESGSLRLDMEYAGDRVIVDRMQVADPSLVRKIALSGAASAEEGVAGDNYWLMGDNFNYCLVRWELTGGRTVYRRYYIDYGALSDTLLALAGDTGYKEGTYPLLTKGAAYEDTLVGLDYQDALGIHEVRIDAASLRGLFETYTSELLSLTAGTRCQEMPVYSIRFVTEDIAKIEEEIGSGDYEYLGYQLDYISRYPVYPSFSGTLGMLGRYGVSPLGPFSADDTDYITVKGYGNWSGDYDLSSPELMVTDHDEIEEILHAPLYSLMAVSNELYPMYYELNVSVGLGGRVITGLYMGYDSVPEFVREYFGIDSEELTPDIWYNDAREG